MNPFLLSYNVGNAYDKLSSSYNFNEFFNCAQAIGSCFEESIETIHTHMIGEKIEQYILANPRTFKYIAEALDFINTYREAYLQYIKESGIVTEVTTSDLRDIAASLWRDLAYDKAFEINDKLLEVVGRERWMTI